MNEGGGKRERERERDWELGTGDRRPVIDQVGREEEVL